MTWMHTHPTTADATPEDQVWRERCEAEFGLRPDPAERDRYPAGYWAACYAAWKAEQPPEANR